MVIKRRDTKTGQPARRPLGHVTVCIDDLQALIDLLADRPDVTSDVVVEFDEGHFTEGRDLRELGGASLRELRVAAGDLVVHLGDRRAEAIGPAAQVEFVDNAWARSRQTQRYPDSWKRSERYSYKLWPTIMAVLASGPIIALVITSQARSIAQFALVGLMAIIWVFVVWLTYWTNKQAHYGAAWALIRPLTAHEIRQLEAQRRGAVVPVWSLVVAIAAFLVSTTFLIVDHIGR